MKHIFCAVLLVITGTAFAEAQVASHAPTLPVAKAMPQAATAASSAPSSKGLTVMPAFQVTGKAVAKVNGVVLTDKELLREMYTIFPYAQQHNGFPKELEPEIRRGALEMIIFDELVYQEAKRRNVTIPPDKMAGAEKAFRKQFSTTESYQTFLKSETNGSEAAMNDKIRRALMIETVLVQEVEANAQITTAQAKAYYDKNLKKYEHEEEVHIQSISIIPPSTNPAILKEARQHAEDAAKQAKQTKNFREFGLVAEKLSDDDYRVNLGDRKTQNLSSFPPPLQKALAGMKPGDVSDLIPIGNAFTIVRLEARNPAGTTPFAEVKTQLQTDMQKEKTQQLRSALDQKLRKGSTIETM
jgi:parvulin-like peptidyl-prolyl isomerase